MENSIVIQIVHTAYGLEISNMWNLPKIFQQKLHLFYITFSVIWKISVSTFQINKVWCLVMAGLADVDGLKF